MKIKCMFCGQVHDTERDRKKVQDEQIRQIASNIICGFLEWAQDIRGLEPANLYQAGAYRVELIEEYLHYQHQTVFGDEHESA